MQKSPELFWDFETIAKQDIHASILKVTTRRKINTNNSDSFKSFDKNENVLVSIDFLRIWKISFLCSFLYFPIFLFTEDHPSKHYVLFNRMAQMFTFTLLRFEGLFLLSLFSIKTVYTFFCTHPLLKKRFHLLQVKTNLRQILFTKIIQKFLIIQGKLLLASIIYNICLLFRAFFAINAAIFAWHVLLLLLYFSSDLFLFAVYYYWWWSIISFNKPNDWNDDTCRYDFGQYIMTISSKVFIHIFTNISISGTPSKLISIKKTQK